MAIRPWHAGPRCWFDSDCYHSRCMAPRTARGVHPGTASRQGSRIGPLLLFGWALVATVLTAGPERIAGWLTERLAPELPPPVEASPVAVYGPPVEVGALPGWAGDDVSEALPALLRSCGRLLGQAADRPLKPVELGGTPGDWRPLCGALRGLGDAAGEEEVRAVIERELVAVPLSRADAPDAGGPTGRRRELDAAHRPLHRLLRAPASWQPSPQRALQRAAVHAAVRPRHGRPGPVPRRSAGPPGWPGGFAAGNLEPYDDREEIASGSLAGRGLELIWVDDAIDAFFLHIQGSGRVELDDGSMFRVGYAAQNGHPYHAIGRTLVDWGELKLEEVSLQSIDAWLRTHPDRAGEVMATNDSYVFFRQIRGEGPIGAQGVALTPERSLAVDRQHVPLGVPVWLDAMTPAAASEGPDERRQWLLVAQDTGGAIRGSVRGDVFWGAGERARAIAGRMAHRGRYWVLVPRGVADRPHPVGASPRQP